MWIAEVKQQTDMRWLKFYGILNVHIVAMSCLKQKLNFINQINSTYKGDSLFRMNSTGSGKILNVRSGIQAEIFLCSKIT